MDKDKVKFAPFHAINDFMLPDFRLHLLMMVLARLDQLDGDHRNVLNAAMKRSLKLPGFRNPLQAPLPLKVKGSVPTFERNPEFVAHLIAAWTDLQPDLRQQMYDLLLQRGWELLPVDTDRTKLPGFLTRWPGADSFEQIVNSFRATYPENQATDNDICLMAVWLGGRLPYEVVSGEQENHE